MRIINTEFAKLSASVPIIRPTGQKNTMHPMEL
jgi:hypothetical protein